MKYIISTLAIGICCLLVSCNNEQENAITDNTTDLASFEATLAKSMKGKLYIIITTDRIIQKK